MIPRAGSDNKVPMAMTCPFGENASDFTYDSRTSTSRRTCPVSRSSHTTVLVGVGERWELPAWIALPRISLTIARLRPSGANSHAVRAADSVNSRLPLATSNACTQPSPHKATDRPSREKTARSTSSRPPIPMRGSFSSFGRAMGRSCHVAASQRRRVPSPKTAITVESSSASVTPRRMCAPAFAPSTDQL
jgi:hypothetical protein